MTSVRKMPLLRMEGFPTFNIRYIDDGIRNASSFVKSTCLAELMK